MGFKVFDYRTDIQNLVVTPEIRGRFMRMEPGTVAQRHSHDLGHEIFLILEGQAEFEIEGHREVLGPGQLCFARRDEMHQVRVIGDQPMTLYLSVTPHIEPTHTQWDDQGQKRPPRYGTWRAPERDGEPDTTTPLPVLVDLQLAAARAVADAANALATAQEAQAATLKSALNREDGAAARATVDEIWQNLYAFQRKVGDLLEAWNALAPRAAPTRPT